MFMSHKTWPIYTILLLFFNVVAAGGFVYLGARTLKTYDVWRTEVIGWEKTYEDKDEEVEKKLLGDPDSESVDALSLATMRTRLSKALAHRGRAWGLLDAETRAAEPLRGQPPILANISAMGNVVTAELAWRLPESPEKMGLAKEMSVYLFADTLADPAAKVNGDHYFGHFKIDSVEPKGLKLTRIEGLLPDENVQNNNRPVLIFELFPNDDYRTFAGKTVAELKQLLPNVPDATLEQFAKHGKTITAAEEQALLSQMANDDESTAALGTLNKANVWHRVTVKQPLLLSEISGKVAPAPMPAGVEDDGGNPIEPDAETPASFRRGSKILLDPDSAKQLVAAGKVEYDGADYRVYMRPLRDYPSEYKRLRENFLSVNMAIAEVERLEALNAITKQSTEATIAQHQARTALINEDLANLKKETAALTAYEAKIRQRLSAAQTERLALLDNINKTAAAITQFQMEALRKVNEQIAIQEQASASE
jgi:hypothetical protein